MQSNQPSRIMPPCPLLSFLSAASLLYLLLSLTACVSSGGGGGATIRTPAAQIPSQHQPLAPAPARLSIFVNEKKNSGPDIEIVVSSLAVRANGVWQEILPEGRAISSANSATGQSFLARAALNPATYDGLRLTIASAQLTGKDGKRPLALARATFEENLANPVALRRNDHPALFLHWDTEASLAHGSFTPAFFVSRQDTNLTRDLLLASCPDLDTVYVIRTDGNRVAGSFGIPGRPTWMALMPNKRDLLVLTTDEPAIKIVELSTGLVRDRIHLTMMKKPVRMVIDARGENAFVIGDDNLILAVDLFTGTIRASQRHGDRLDYLIHLPERRQLAVLSELSQELLLIDSSTLNRIATVRTSPNATGLAAADNFLFYSEPFTSSVVRYDLKSGETQRRLLAAATSMIVHESNLFGASAGKKSVFMLDYQIMSAIRSIDLPAPPSQLAVSAERQWLYAGSAEPGAISVIDLGSRSLTASIPLEAATLGLVVRD